MTISVGVGPDWEQRLSTGAAQELP